MLLPALLLACAAPSDPDPGAGADEVGADDGADSGGGADEGGTDSGGSTDGGGDSGTAGPGEQQLFVNELLAANEATLVGPTGGRPDWIELYNAGPDELSLLGWSITDDLDEPDKHVLDDLRIPAGGFLLLYADDRPEHGPDHLAFALGAGGEAIGLYRPDGGAEDLVEFAPQSPDRAPARVPDGAATWVVAEAPSPGASNGGEGPAAPDPRDAVSVESVPGSDVDDAVLFSDDTLPDFQLTLSEDALEDLRRSPYDWVEARLVYDGREYAPVGVRTKGENSWQPIDEKPSLKIDLAWHPDGPGSLLGLAELTLQNMDNDPTLMHERLAYLVYREAGLAASRATHATVSINGESRGLYTHLETVDGLLIARHFDDADGSLFEQWDVDYTDAGVDSFQLEHGADDRTALQGVADAMELATASERVDAAAAHLSWDSFRTYWAVGAVVGQFDAYPYSSPGDDCHVYADPESGVLHYLPHGADETFSHPTHGVETAARGLLSTACRQDADCRAAWVAEVRRVLDLTDAVGLLERFDRIQEQVAPLVAADDRKPWTDAEVAAGQAAMREFIVERREELQGQLGFD